jgi:NTE family protein
MPNGSISPPGFFTWYHDARRTLRHPEVLEQPKDLEGLFTFDLMQDSRE